MTCYSATYRKVREFLPNKMIHMLSIHVEFYVFLGGGHRPFFRSKSMDSVKIARPASGVKLLIVMIII